MPNLLNIMSTIVLYGIPILFAVTLHEVSHGWAALRLGDPTAKMLGRLTVNPIKHIDPIGTILVPIILFNLSGFIFGWAKPVPITWQNLRNPRRDIALVALAGPFANLVMAFFWGMVLKICVLYNPVSGSPLHGIAFMSQVGIMINLVLMVLNLMPIPPLDGSRVLTSFVSPRIANLLAQFEVYGFLILVLLLASGVLLKIMVPIIETLLGLMRLVLGL